jgi:hypothetical protein
MWKNFEQNFDMSSLVLGDDVPAFIKDERGNAPKKPTILIVGSSYNGMGIKTDSLEKKLNQPVGKITISSSSAWHNHRTMMKFETECQNVKLILIDIEPWQFQSKHRKNFTKSIVLYLKSFGELKLPSIGYEHPSIGEILLPLKYSLRDLKNCQNKNVFYGHESYWNHHGYKAKQRKNFELIKKYAEERLQQKKLFSKESVQLTNRIDIDNDLVKYVFQFVDYCKKRGIFVVITVTPQWIGIDDHYPELNTTDHGQRKFLALLDELDVLSNCRVLPLRNLEPLLPVGTKDEDYFIDSGHLNRAGAELYTSWLSEKIINDAKIMSSINNQRNSSKFSSTKYISFTYKKIINFFKKTRHKELRNGTTNQEMVNK